MTSRSKRCISCQSATAYGENNHNWRGGRTLNWYENYSKPYRANNPEKIHAHRAVVTALRRGDLVKLDDRLPAVPLLCDVENFDFSGHATREELLDYILAVKPKKTFLVHGDDDSVAWFAAQLKEKLPSTEAIAPEPGRNYEL
jgi:hypothetical protein